MADKVVIPPGPWDDEPDRLEWRAHGMPCLMQRAPIMGHWCGYVAVPPGHRLHGASIDAASEAVDVHGGVTYAASCAGNICHEPAAGEPDDVFWLGMDFAHAHDLIPMMAHGMFDERREVLGEEYRDVAYVREAVEDMAAQLAR